MKKEELKTKLEEIVTKDDRNGYLMSWYSETDFGKFEGIQQWGNDFIVRFSLCDYNGYSEEDIQLYGFLSSGDDNHACAEISPYNSNERYMPSIAYAIASEILDVLTEYGKELDMEKALESKESSKEKD